jgi:DDE superfamily endonuclease
MSTVRSSTNPIAVSAADTLQSDDETRGSHVERSWADYTDNPKKRRHSIGVTRLYCGQLGKQDNGKIVANLLIANRAASLPRLPALPVARPGER